MREHAFAYWNDETEQWDETDRDPRDRTGQTFMPLKPACGMSPWFYIVQATGEAHPKISRPGQPQMQQAALQVLGDGVDFDELIAGVRLPAVATAGAGAASVSSGIGDGADGDIDMDSTEQKDDWEERDEKHAGNRENSAVDVEPDDEHDEEHKEENSKDEKEIGGAGSSDPEQHHCSCLADEAGLFREGQIMSNDV
jgi:hypothetical protein